ESSIDAVPHRAGMVPAAVLRDPAGDPEQASRRHGDVWLHFYSLFCSLARQKPGAVGSIQADIQAVLLDSGHRLLDAYLRGWATSRRDLVGPEQVRRGLLFPALPCGLAAGRKARTSDTIATQHRATGCGVAGQP